MDFLKLDDLQYLIEYPQDFSKSKTYPVLFFLHGAGTRGNDINRVANNVFFKLMENHSDLPFVLVAPLCSKDTWFDLWENLENLVNHICDLPFADKDRVYLIGNSMGGYGTWQLGMSMPHIFSAIVPVCGGGMYWNAGRLKNVPVWAFHGALDGTVLPEESKKMVNSLNAFGGNAKLTIYPEAAHDAWTPTYSNREVFEWMLSHKKCENNKELTNEYADQKKFG